MTPCEIPDLSTNTSSVLVRNFEQSLGSLRMSFKRANSGFKLPNYLFGALYLAAFAPAFDIADFIALVETNSST